MTRKKISDALGQIDDRHVTEVAEFAGKKKKPLWLRWGAIAACFVLTVSACAILWHLPTDDPPVTDDPLVTDDPPSPPTYNPPVYNQAYLSAEDVEKAFEPVDGATSSYTKVCRPANRPLKLNDLPTDEYAEIYQLQPLIKSLSAQELNAFAESVLPKLTTALGMSADSFEKNEYVHNDSLTVSYRNNASLRLYFEQQSGEDDYGIDFATTGVWVSNGDRQLVLNGQTVQIDQRQSDEEILASLEWVRDILFDAFGCSLDQSKIIFSYSTSSSAEYGECHVYVYYYEETEDGRMGDYIQLYFDNYANSSDETVNTDIINKCSVSYCSYRIPPDDYYTVEATCKLISLDEAEELLANGYVFGGHVCPLCMAEQEKVSFDEYDAVSFEYVTNVYGDPARSVPFYAFYKKIGTAENGNIIYAKTYVCAIEVSGLAEYFDGQQNNHVNFEEYVAE